MAFIKNGLWPVTMDWFDLICFIYLLLLSWCCCSFFFLSYFLDCLLCHWNVKTKIGCCYEETCITDITNLPESCNKSSAVSSTGLKTSRTYQQKDLLNATPQWFVLTRLPPWMLLCWTHKTQSNTNITLKQTKHVYKHHCSDEAMEHIKTSSAHLTTTQWAGSFHHYNNQRPPWRHSCGRVVSTLCVCLCCLHKLAFPLLLPLLLLPFCS